MSWLQESLENVREGKDALFARFGAAGRKLGAEADRGRKVLLLAALESMARDRHVAVVEELYCTGEIGERQAVLKALPDLPEPARFVAIGVEAVRENALSIVEAIACENPYPARHFPDGAFNQMVMKCLFNGIALSRIAGLAERRTADLKRMVTDYVQERRAAGRPVPADAALIVERNSDASV